MTHTIPLNRAIFLACKFAYIEALTEGIPFCFYTPLDFL